AAAAETLTIPAQSPARARFAPAGRRRIPAVSGADERARVGADALAPVERVDRPHLISGELEVEHVEVLADSLRRDRLRDHDVAELQVPANHDLPRAAPVTLGDLYDRGLVEHLSLGERAPRLGHDSQLVVFAAQPHLLEVRVQLDLVDRRRLAGLLDQAAQMLGLEVRDPDRADQAL